MSALRGLRASDREIVTWPWLYEIAKNASPTTSGGRGAARRCRSTRRRGLRAPGGRPHLAVRGGTDAEVARRESLESLRMAFGDLAALPARDPRDAGAGRALLRPDRLADGTLAGCRREHAVPRAAHAAGGLRDTTTAGGASASDGAEARAAGGRRTACASDAAHSPTCATARRAAARPSRSAWTSWRWPRPASAAAPSGAPWGCCRCPPSCAAAATARRFLNVFGPAAETGGSLAVKAGAVVAAAVIAAGGAGGDHGLWRGPQSPRARRRSGR